MTDTNQLTLTTDQFESLPVHEQAQMLRTASTENKRLWLRVLALDDVVDVLQQFKPAEQEELLKLLDARVHADVKALLAWAEDVATGLMNPRYLSARPDMTIQETLLYVREQATSRTSAKTSATSYIYVVRHDDQKLLGIVTSKQLIAASGTALVQDIMFTDLVTVRPDCDQEEIARIFHEHKHLKLKAIPVVDADGRMKGVVSLDDIVEVVRKEATEDIQKMGGMEALDLPYMTTGIMKMVRKRAIFLVTLFLGEMLTATVMTVYQDTLSKFIALAVFMPLIMSAGGNAGSQSTTLVIRGMALGEIRLSYWWKVMRREVVIGTILGIILGAVALLRILAFHDLFGQYDDHFAPLTVAVILSVALVVLWGNIAGSLLPFGLKLLRLDPAVSSNPAVSVFVDVTGLLIYFNVSRLILVGVAGVAL
jgi:magnesium transporter